MPTMNMKRERHKRLHSIAQRFIEREMPKPDCGSCAGHLAEMIESLTTVLENVDHYARQDKVGPYAENERKLGT